VERFTIDDLRSGSMAWDARVPTTPGIDPWCTRLAWQLSVHKAFGARSISSTEPDATLGSPAPTHLSLLGTSSPDDGLFVATADWSMALRKQQFDSTAGLVPLDAVWGFASPFVLTNAEANPFQIQQWANEMGEVLLHEPDWELAFLAGLAPGSPLDDALLRALSSQVRLVAGEPTIRCVASLVGGPDAFLERRSRSFCRNLRQATARANAAGLTIESVDVRALSGTEVLQRLIAIESQSWKGLEDSGITSPDMATLYTGLIDLFHAEFALSVADSLVSLPASQIADNAMDHRGDSCSQSVQPGRIGTVGRSPKTHLPHGDVDGIRLSVARLDGADVGFILGGVIDGRYRGLQLSFAQSVRALSIGNLLQLHEIRSLCSEGVHTYDLGMDMEYKRAWSDSVFVTRPIIAVRQ
jgi:Acetyltransferase (GNAT) domain